MLTYCTNIHAGESWLDVRANVESHGLAVKNRFSPHDPFPLGLRLSGRAAEELDHLKAKRFADWLGENGCFVSSLNGFPYGQFHGQAVKEKVYLPDWRSQTRVDYSCRAADWLAHWLPAGMRGSISTVPVAFKRSFQDSDWPLVRRRLVDALEHLARRYELDGTDIALAIEPEPRCVLETTDETTAFFERMDLPERLVRHLGLCYDCCHQAVEFEDPQSSLSKIQAAGIRIEKVQVSSCPRASGTEIELLSRFVEPTYLHQAVARKVGGELVYFDDLPDFLGARLSDVEECRVHFHVPVFLDQLESHTDQGPSLGTTRFFLEDILPRFDPSIPLEVETYSWAVLPADQRGADVVDSILQELQWTQKALRRCTEPRSSMLSV